MNEMIQAKGRVKVFACGGGGINIGSLLEKHRGSNDLGFAEIDVVYIDTSRSNLSKQHNPDYCYLLDALDGSGKVRSENYNEISSRIRDILLTHKPADINIVLSTAAGGSGSVIAPLLVGEMLERDIPVIALTVGASDTRLETENTLKTLKSYDAIAQKCESPVVLGYVANDPGHGRMAADKKLESLIVSLCILYSRQNHELDSRDLFNFLRFNRVTSFPKGVAALSLVDRGSNTKDLGNIISVATLAAAQGTTAVDPKPEYQCVGYLPEGIATAVVDSAPLHFMVTDGVLPKIAAELQEILRQMDDSRGARLSQGGLLGKNDKPTETGLVL